MRRKKNKIWEWSDKIVKVAVVFHHCRGPPKRRQRTKAKCLRVIISRRRRELCLIGITKEKQRRSTHTLLAWRRQWCCCARMARKVGGDWRGWSWDVVGEKRKFGRFLCIPAKTVLADPGAPGSAPSPLFPRSVPEFRLLENQTNWSRFFPSTHRDRLDNKHLLAKDGTAARLISSESEDMEWRGLRGKIG